jgi:hypothetical protein
MPECVGRRCRCARKSKRTRVWIQLASCCPPPTWRSVGARVDTHTVRLARRYPKGASMAQRAQELKNGYYHTQGLRPAILVEQMLPALLVYVCVPRVTRRAAVTNLPGRRSARAPRPLP